VLLALAEEIIEDRTEDREEEDAESPDGLLRRRAR